MFSIINLLDIIFVLMVIRTCFGPLMTLADETPLIENGAEAPEPRPETKVAVGPFLSKPCAYTRSGLA